MIRSMIGISPEKWGFKTGKDLLRTRLLYKEHDDIYRLFKNMYVKRNLAERDYDEMRQMFKKFVPEGLLKESGFCDPRKMTLGASVQKYLHIMFLDMIGFTSIIEELSNDKSLMLLNIYFEGIVSIVKKKWGYIDKFLWDGIMVLFDTPNADIVVETSIEIQQFISRFQISEVGKKISVGIGINSWEVILWTVGSQERMQVTVIWDVVNTASRIESLSRNYDENILISEATHVNIVEKEKFNIHDLGMVGIRGKKSQTHIYGIWNFQNIHL